jgi:replication factor A2
MYGGYSSNAGGSGGFFSNNSYGEAKTPTKENSDFVGSPGFKKSNGEQSLRPMTIYQVHESKEVIANHPLVCDNKPVQSISLVAKVINIKEQSTHVRYTLEDGTGVIEAALWSTDGKSEAEVAAQSKIEVNGYVQVIGAIRLFSGKKSIQANSLKPVTDINQITYHGLMTAWVHLMLTRGVILLNLNIGANDWNKNISGTSWFVFFRATSCCTF